MGANGSTPTFDDLKDVVAALRQQNAPFGSPGWVFNPRLLATLEKFKASDGRYLADAGLLTFDSTGAGGTLLGYRFATTTQIPLNLVTGSNSDCTEIYFSSDWDEAWLGIEDELRIEVSNEASYTSDGGSTWHSAWQQRQHLFRATWTHDLGLRRPQLFTCVVGVRP
jgi:HK97 family phage major capsid protein